MLGSRPKKMMNMYIYDILRRNTDAEHPMTQREIQKRLESEYDMTVDRKAVKANLEDLINDGSYNIEYSTKIRFTPNRSTGEIEKSEILTGFYYNNVFTDSELRLLMDSVLFSKSIPMANKKELLVKLKDLSNKYFKFSTANIRFYEAADREINKELFYTIEVLDEAISNGLQVKFLYNEYGVDKKLHHRINKNGDVREYIINPYTMVANGGKYYLICNYDKYDNLSHYRIDRISNIEILDTPRKPKKQVEGLVGLDVAKYMQEHIFMFGGKSIRAKFEMPKYLISDVLDSFGANVNFTDIGDGNVHFNLSQPVAMEKQAFLDLWKEMNGIVHGIVREMGGSISAEHGIGQLKRDELERLGDPAALALMRAVKSALDPGELLNPGKLVPQTR